MTSTDQDAGNAGQLAPRTAPLALYRRYRPATFAELKGQDHVTEPLRQALRSGRVNHAYLFSGPRGCGKTSSARILARSLNCEEGPTPDPCGKCASCIALAPSGPGSIDVIEIDAASHGGIDDARDLRERAFYSPVSARYKIYIIDEAHMVTGAGFNALLKLVEEPPPHLKFVFATTEPEKVIPTIRSRTHHYPFRLMPPATMRDLLEEILEAEKIEFEPAVLPVVIRAGAGSARDTLSIVDQLIAGADESGLRYDRAIALLGYTDDALLDEMIEAFAAGDGALVFRAIDHVVEGGHDPRRFAMDTLDRLRDLIVLAAIPDASVSGLLDVPEDQLERMRGQASRFGQERLVRAAETINSGLVEMRGATSPRLLLELMCAQVLLPATPAAAPAPASAAPVARRGGEDLDARVDRLERELRTALDRLASASAGAREPERRPARTGPEPRERQRPQADYDRAPAGPADHASARPGRGDADRQQAVSRREPDASGGSRAVGGLDAATLRGRWADILDSIRDIRKVAWLLLSNASVEAVDGDVVTIAFPREGDAKGFGGNGCDQDLATVIERLLGTRPTIRTSVQSASGGGFDDARSSSAPGNVGSRAQPGQAGRARADDPWGDEFQGRPAAAGGSDDQAADGRSSRGRAPAGPVTTAETSGRPSSDERAQPSSKSRKGERQPEDAQGRPGPDAGGSRSSASADDARVTGPRGGGRRSVEADDSSLRDDPRFMTDSDPADSGSDVTGSDLILRELGGKVIEEISEG